MIRNISSGIAKKITDRTNTTAKAAIGDSITDTAIDINQFRFCFLESLVAADVALKMPMREPTVDPTSNPKPRKNMLPNSERQTDLPPYIPPVELAFHQTNSAEDAAPTTRIARNRV